MSDRITVVPVVKAYPALLRDLDEAVCVAGFRTAMFEQPAWVRLFPVPFRELDAEQQFKKWQEISLVATPTSKDRRPESLLPQNSTIQVVRNLKPAERNEIINSVPAVSMCGLMRQQALDGTSLGLVRPRTVVDVIVEARDADEVRSQQERVDAAAGQQKLFGPQLSPLEILPHRFLYRYLCEDADCGGHRQGIVDWEISAAYRKWRHAYPTDFIERIRHKWFDELCAPDRDTRFFVGNMHQHPQSFLVLGVHWPKR